jgi:Uncharacterized protein conserved in bacteria
MRILSPRATKECLALQFLKQLLRRYIRSPGTVKEVLFISLLPLSLLLWLAAYGVSALVKPHPTLSETVFKRLMLHDFNRSVITNNLGGEGQTWTGDSDDSESRAEYTLTSSEGRGESGNSLYLLYKLNPHTSSKSGFRMKLNGLDATDYDHLEFWVKGDAHQGYTRSFKVEFQRPYHGSREILEKGSFIVTGITAEWQRVTVPLNTMNGIMTWSNLEDFVITFHSRRAEVKKGAYYIDDIALIKTGNPGPHVKDKVISVKKEAWEKTLGGQEATKPHIFARVAGWPSTLLIDKSQLPDDDHEFLLRLARDTWRGLDALTDREHGLPLDTVRFSKGSVAPEKAHIGDYTNITNVGLYLLAVVAASELEFIAKQQALERLNKTLSTLEKLEMHQGFFYNYYDTTSLERTSHFISFVDSAWLTTGLMVVRTAFHELYDRCTRLIHQGHYERFYDNVEQLMSHGYYVNLKYPSEYHYGLLYTESRIGSLIAIGKGDVPQEHWFKMLRTFPAEHSWQTLPPRSRKTKVVRGSELTGGYYEWDGLKFIPSWGGSLFEALMPTLVVDEKKYAPNSFGINNEVHATIHRRYALEALNYPVWGMSPSSSVGNDNYSEYGVQILGAKGYNSGIITPYASALALYATPEAAIANLRKLAALYNIYGEYGFYDAVDPLSGEVAPKYLALDQSMLFIALANYLKDHSVQKHFAADPIAANALALIGEESFFE